MVRERVFLPHTSCIVHWPVLYKRDLLYMKNVLSHSQWREGWVGVRVVGVRHAGSKSPPTVCPSRPLASSSLHGQGPLVRRFCPPVHLFPDSLICFFLETVCLHHVDVDVYMRYGVKPPVSGSVQVRQMTDLSHQKLDISSLDLT